MGNCLMAGQGQAPARQAALGAGLPQSAGAVTLSKMCGSGMRAMMFAHDMLKAESAEIVVAGGMESMTNAPHLTFARKGVRYGADAALRPHGDRRPRGRVRARQGDGRLRRAVRRQVQVQPRGEDQFAIDSTKRSKQANEDGSFAWEIAPVTVQGKAGDDRGPVRRAAVQGQARQDPGPEARVQEGRHDHRRDARRASPTAPPRWC